MRKLILFVFLWGALLVKQILLMNANDCYLNTECVHIADCPLVYNNFNYYENKPYCNLEQNDTFVCCLKAPEKYNQDKDEDIRTVKVCKSFQSYRPSCSKSLIVGGNKTKPKEFPFMALLFYKLDNTTKPKCGGTLITNKFVLTAAHCFYHGDIPTMVRLGELDWTITTDDAMPVDYEIQNIFIHPKYFSAEVLEKYNDIALVELDKEVKYNAYILPACLPLVDGREFPEYIAAGWGFPSDTSTDPTSHMFKVKLDRFDDDVCFKKIAHSEALYSGVNNRTQMCAGSFTHKRDTCSGDSGGPLFVDHPDYNCLTLVLGITSFGPGGCGSIGQPGVYTRIQLYLDWIEKIIWKEGA